ncbi:hypothetical protein AMTR_s00102p00065130 [Amborella trichopoda]|uniref:Uncharacterized protein n=1 Tax=Amborella trichopoda TaxID=13333 RepID=W1NXZ4_AMBTC|nr:hypothetical protein AMTR_s00102p00065130 [Amborella trichopoda]
MELSAIKPFSYFFQTLIHAPHSANSSSYKLKTFQKPSELQTAGTRAPLKMAQCKLGVNVTHLDSEGERLLLLLLFVGLLTPLWNLFRYLRSL